MHLFLQETFKSLALLRQSRAAGMQGVDHCINGVTARLMYKAAGRTMGAEKIKQQAEAETEQEEQRNMESSRD